jgi:ABC-2 type transport system permease protein
MILLVWLELQKIFKRWRTYIGFIAVGLITAIVQLALYFTGQRIIDASMRSLENSFVMVGNLFNGYFIAHMILGALIIHIPFLVVLVGGDLLAGEATAGTYRMLLTRPVSRFQVVTSKFIAAWIFVLVLLLWLALTSIGVSLIIFGSGPLLSIGGSGLAIIAQNDLWWRFFCAYAYALLSMMTVISLSILFSSLVQNAIGPIVATMAIIFVFLILGAIPIDILQDIKPYLFTSHMTQWNNFFSDPPDYKEVLDSALVLLAYTSGLYGITTVIFLRKDILS